MNRTIGVIGLGYVGLPLALALAQKSTKKVYGFDINAEKVSLIQRGVDPTNEGLERLLAKTSLSVTAQIADLAPVDFFIVGVPTPVDENNTPDLTPLRSACPRPASGCACPVYPWLCQSGVRARVPVRLAPAWICPSR